MCGVEDTGTNRCATVVLVSNNTTCSTKGVQEKKTLTEQHGSSETAMAVVVLRLGRGWGRRSGGFWAR